MSAFAAALAALHRDPNISVECSWAPGWERSGSRGLVADLVVGTVSLVAYPAPLRGVRSQPIDAGFASPGGNGAVTARQTLDVAQADLSAAPMRNDLVVIGAENFTVEKAERDLEALSWRLTLSNA